MTYIVLGNGNINAWIDTCTNAAPNKTEKTPLTSRAYSTIFIVTTVSCKLSDKFIIKMSNKWNFNIRRYTFNISRNKGGAYRSTFILIDTAPLWWKDKWKLKSSHIHQLSNKETTKLVVAYDTQVIEKRRTSTWKWSKPDAIFD